MFGSVARTENIKRIRLLRNQVRRGTDTRRTREVKRDPDQLRRVDRSVFRNEGRDGGRGALFGAARQIHGCAVEGELLGCAEADSGAGRVSCGTWGGWVRTWRP